MDKRYYNKNHSIHRTDDPFKKVASVYDKQGISNRGEEKKPVTFSSLAPYEAEAIHSLLEKDASELEDVSINKTAAPIGTPFELFGQTKNYIANKIGVSDEVAHDMASSVIAKGEEMQNQYGGNIQDVVSGIVDSMDATEVKLRTGAIPMKPVTKVQLQEAVKEKLMSTMNLSSYEADRVKMNVVQQARNLSTQMRQIDVARIADAIIEVMVEYNDISVVYDISSSDRMINDVKAHLNTET